ncbi:hypothetical protein D3C77_663000 [compost metagenome]
MIGYLLPYAALQTEFLLGQLMVQSADLHAGDPDLGTVQQLPSPQTDILHLPVMRQMMLRA